ncbi:MAG: CBS domain-containing protein [Ilumatobacter sp.]|jgi:CBS domain-containing protein|uniref:CBS domain-containing protein n=1 Tax=Ilumatobacter sp. TaxID=1967498 RepID=UPI001DCF9DA8|nr:CBS domain-containing protein [Ilumatobacter sp.]MBT5275967.1 CBS domain-containing protein [Ilumatobacter sp.]MBT5555165.1 CBS domain-containing protein [Ilumatobacter sp.]MBT5866363.1 CBS domain-containing protein [Ilumatobacter sp.]MBT7429586.1 CBS domain-containing protein [Ilumatobacter sp.]
MNVQSILAAKGNAVAKIAATSTLSEAVAALRDHGIGALVVSADGNNIDGILSERDVVRSIASHGDDTMHLTVGSAMSSNVITCAPADSIDTLMEMMTERRIRHLPVLALDGAIAGIISIGDVVKYRLVELENENSQLHDYIDGRV